MTQQHPVTPPPNLVEKWIREANHNEPMFAQVAVMGAKWGADQELEACCEWLDNEIGASDPNDLYAERRPNPLSLKEQALAAVAELKGFKGVDTIRRALKTLDD